MQRPAEVDILPRAYELWERAGKPDGRDSKFYHQAERELQKQTNKPSQNSRVNAPSAASAIKDLDRQRF